MKKFILTICFIFTFALSAFAFFDNANQTRADDVSDVLTANIKTLKYEQKQLVAAILLGNEDAVKTILDSDTNPKTTYSGLPLTFYAVYSGNVNILKLLIDYGFNENQTFLDVSPLEIAIALKRYSCIEYLLEIGVIPNEDDYVMVNKSKDKRLKKLFKKVEQKKDF